MGSFHSAHWPGWTSLQPPANIHCEVSSLDALSAWDTLLLESIWCLFPLSSGSCLNAYHPVKASMTTLQGQLPPTEAHHVCQLRVSH